MERYKVQFFSKEDNYPGVWFKSFEMEISNIAKKKDASIYESDEYEACYLWNCIGK